MFDSFYVFLMWYAVFGCVLVAPGAIATFIINRRIDRRYGK